METVHVVIDYRDPDGGELLGVAATPEGGRAIAELGRDDSFWRSDWRQGSTMDCEYRKTQFGVIYVWKELVQHQSREACEAAKARQEQAVKDAQA